MNRLEGAWPLYIAWVIIFCFVIGLTLTCVRENMSFYGIAETREIIINWDESVEIEKISVVEGQEIRKGQMLVQLTSPELTLRINTISHQLDQLKAQKGVNIQEIKSNIRQLEAEKESLTTETHNRIQQLESKLALNQELTASLKSIDTKDSVDRRNDEFQNQTSPTHLHINNLKEELQLALNPLNIKIELLQAELAASESPLKIQAERLEKELELLSAEKGKLNIYGQFAGIVGSVHYKNGEKVAPFSPILTVHTKTPSYIKGYIYENVYTRIDMGDKLYATSLADSRNMVDGAVVGIGARIVEYPIRLRKNPEYQMWGREVLVQIPQNNPFILGEKVLLQSHRSGPSFIQSMAVLISPEPLHAAQDTTQDKSEKPVMDLSITDEQEHYAE